MQRARPSHDRARARIESGPPVTPVLPRAQMARFCEGHPSQGTYGMPCAAIRPGLPLAQCCDQFRHDGEQITLQTVIGDAKNRRFRVLVDRDDHL